MEISELYDLFLRHPAVTTDTRDCSEGALFFALRGTSFNGNDFATAALAAGCAYAVVDDPRLRGDDRLIHVDNALSTLQQLAALHRRTLGIPVLQITGTNGKTTTKELVAAVLGEGFRVLFTSGNFNNHIGVPKTLLRLRPEHEMAVIETGANHPGEIAALSRIVDADCGLITNVGKAHLEGFGSFEGVVRTKGELYDYLRTKPGAFIFLNADNPHLCPISQGLAHISYGRTGKGYDVEGEVLSCDPYLRFRWRRKEGEWQEVATHLIGAYNLDNLLAAAAVGIRFGIADNRITHALAGYEPTNNRSELQDTGRNRLIIDAYNANPTSMKAALENFAQMEHPHKMAILGEMRELGTAEEEEHRRILEMLPALRCEEVWLVGEAFRKAAGNNGTFRCFATVGEVKKMLEESPVSDRLVLIKGSNSTRLYQLPESL